MVRRYAYLILICSLLLAFPLPALCASPSASQGYEKARQAYFKLQKSTKKKRYRENWQQVLDLFLQVADKHPGSSRAADALFMAGRVSSELYDVSRVADDARQAVRYYDRLVDNYPKSSLGDDALFAGGQILEQTLHDRSGAYRRFTSLIDKYPGGDMTPKATARRKALSKLIDLPAPASAAKGETKEPHAVGVRIKGVRHASHGDKTRIVIDIDGKPRFKPMILEGDKKAGIPYRILVDIPATDIGSGVDKTLSLKDGRIGKVRTGQFSPELARVVVELERPLAHKAFSLENPSRVIIDVLSEPPTAGQPKTVTTSPNPLPKGDGIALVLDRAPQDEPLKVSVPKAKQHQGVRLIVVDAGHGGRDPGAVGAGGLLEKEVTLAMAKVLARRLRSSLGCEVILTRDKDVYLTLSERTAIANRVGADLFISLHANANKNRKAYGTETYYLNFSKNGKAMEVAARENDTSLKEVGDLEMILLDLMANSKINESSRLAANIQSSMVGQLKKHYKIKDLGVRQGPFYVLLGATMPSVLVETAFISNKREEKLLKNSKYRERTAAAIVKGVEGYIKSFSMIATR